MAQTQPQPGPLIIQKPGQTVNPRQNQVHCSPFSSNHLVTYQGGISPSTCLHSSPPVFYNSHPTPCHLSNLSHSTINASPPSHTPTLHLFPCFHGSLVPKLKKSSQLLPSTSTSQQETLIDLKPLETVKEDFGAKSPFKRPRSILQYQWSRLKPEHRSGHQGFLRL